MALLLLPLCLLAGLPGTHMKDDQRPAGTDKPRSPSITVTDLLTATKWWIKSTNTSLSSTNPSASPSPGTAKANDCSGFSETDLRIGAYAYIAPFPSIPNRVRAEPMLSSAFLAQVDPGKGVKVIDGPICSDGYSWWFIEALDGQIRGWTVGGRGRDRWILPCPDTDIPCAENLVTASSSPTQADTPDHDYCKSERLAAGMVAQVRHDRLLVLRSKPYSGEVIGHAGPLSQVEVINGPTCVGGTLWWEVRASDGQITGWATEIDLEPY